MVILGISVGTRTSGIAIVNDRGLVCWNTLSFKNSWSEQKAQAIVRKYERQMKEHKVTVVVLKVPRISHQSDAILSLLKKLEEMFAYHGCMVLFQTKNEIKQVVPEVSNTRNLVRYTANLYPILMPEMDRELAVKNSYHDKMFEAVLAAHLAVKAHRHSQK